MSAIKQLQKGDVDMDSNVDVKDVIFVLRHTVGIISLTGDQCLLANIDLNGVVNVKDIIYIQRIIVNASVKPTNPPNEYIEDDKLIELPLILAM